MQRNLMALVFLVGFPSLAAAQVLYGSLTGTVQDSVGAVDP